MKCQKPVFWGKIRKIFQYAMLKILPRILRFKKIIRLKKKNQYPISLQWKNPRLSPAYVLLNVTLILL